MQTILSVGGRLHVTSPAPRDMWAAALAGDPNGLPTQSAAWLEARCAQDGYADASRLYETADGRILVLPMVRRRALGSGRIAMRSSYGEGWGFGGLVAAGGLTHADVAAVLGDLTAHRGLQTLIRPNPLLAREWEAAAVRGVRVIPRAAHVLDLGGGFGQVWAKRFSASARANARKAERAGVVVERGSSSLQLDAFNELFARSVARWSAQQHEPLRLARWRAVRRDPASKFSLLADMLGAAFCVWVARLEDRPVAAAIVLRNESNAHYTRGAMDVELAGPTRANYLIHHRAIEDACETGCRYYHFGETGRSTSLAFFKSRFGAVPYRYAEYRLERLPLTAVDQRLRGAVKRIVGFSDVS